MGLTGRGVGVRSDGAGGVVGSAGGVPALPGSGTGGCFWEGATLLLHEAGAMTTWGRRRRREAGSNPAGISPGPRVFRRC